MTDTAATLTIGPDHHGTSMTLEDFARAEGQPGYIYELERGVVTVVDVPGLPHGLVVQVIRDLLGAYRLAHHERVVYIAGGSDCAVRIPGVQSERHPDVAVHLSAPPPEGEGIWEAWMPDLVVEVVSSSSRERDYRTKREDYLRAGIRLYWIVDPLDRSATVLTRRADTWREERIVAPAALATPLLPGLAIPLTDVFGPLA